MKAKDLMITDVVDVKKDETVRDLLEKLVAHKIGGVPIVDHDRKLLGMVSDGDVLRTLAPREQMIFNLYAIAVVLEKQEMNETMRQKMDQKVETMMLHRKLYTVDPEDDMEEVLKILSKHHFKKIPVVNQAGTVIGVISRGDVIRYINKQILGEGSR